MPVVQLALGIIFCTFVVQCTRADAPAADTSPTGNPCANCFDLKLECITCNDGRHACVSRSQMEVNPVCCGCLGKGPGSVCTLCLPTEPCIKSNWSTYSGYYCYNPSYLEVLDATINQTRYPYNYIEFLPSAGEKAGWILLGSAVALVLMPLCIVIMLRIFGWSFSTADVCSTGSGGGGGSDYGSSWSNDNSSSNNDNSSSGGGNDNSSSSSSWDSGPSYAGSAD